MRYFVLSRTKHSVPFKAVSVAETYEEAESRELRHASLARLPWMRYESAIVHEAALTAAKVVEYCDQLAALPARCMGCGLLTHGCICGVRHAG